MAPRHGATVSRSVSDRSWGQSMVEFALILPVFLLLLAGIIDGAWFVLETSALSNAARQAARWEVAAENFDPTQQQPYCQDPSPNVPAGMVAAAQQGAGPFSALVGSDMTNAPGPTDSDGYDSCTVTITAPFSPFSGLIRIGPQSITTSFTAFTD